MPIVHLYKAGGGLHCAAFTTTYDWAGRSSDADVEIHFQVQSMLHVTSIRLDAAMGMAMVLRSTEHWTIMISE